jgi:5-methyltetrahydrofolate--homocysteine methyltransferase
MKLDLERIRSQVTLADGGWSTQLIQRGYPADQMAERANLTHPELVQRLAKEYADAGSQIVLTNTFAANRFTLERHDAVDDLAPINTAGARAAQQAIGDRASIAGSIGPSGKILAVKEIDEGALTEAVMAQTQALIDGGVDAIVLETYSEMAEVLCALAAVKSVCELPVICSMSFSAGPQRTRTMMGTPAEEAAAALDDAGADIIGCNCGAGIEHVLPIVVALRGATERPIWVKPNAGQPELEDGRPVWKQTPDEFASHLPTLMEAGANIIGGCCGSGPEHIARLSKLLHAHRR